MKTFRDFLYEQEEVESVKYRLAEMPQRIQPIPRNKVIKDLNDFWELAQDENPTVVGKIGSEEVHRVGNSSIRYYFILKNNKPTFFIGLDKRMDLSGWQISYVGKINAAAKYIDVLKFLLKEQGIFIISGLEQSPVAEKIWKKILKSPKTEYRILDDDTGKEVDISIDDAWPSNAVFKITKIN